VFFAGVIGIVAFLCNTLVDVPAHRLGTILPALFVLAMCSSPKLLFSGTRWVRWISRAAGISLIVLALALLRASSMVVPSQQAFAKGDWDAVTKNIDSALQIAPLEWSLYLMRGSVNVQTRDWIAALADFRAARVIEPKLAVVPFDEGCAWLGANPKLVVVAWQEALTKRRGDQTLYPQMLDKSLPYPEIQQALLCLAHTDLDLALEIIETSYADDATLDLVERERSKLNSDQRTMLDRVESCQYARVRDYRQAYQLGTRTLSHVVFPPHRTITEDECRLLLLRDPSNYAAAYDLCSILASQERKPELLSVLNSLIKQKDCPGYFYVMKGDLLASTNDWSGAWDAISELVAHPR
jgi:hypothetical protein